MYMLPTSEHKSTLCATKKYQIALDSGATTHVMNASSLDGCVEVMHTPSTIKTVHQPHVCMWQYISDGAPVLISKDIVELVHKRGTKVCWSPSYTPELNAVVEHSQQTIFNMGHSILLGAVVSMKYWTYAIQYAAYIYNRFPTNTEERVHGTV